MINIIEKASDIGLNNVPDLSKLQVELQVLYCLLGTAIGSISITGVYKVRFKIDDRILAQASCTSLSSSTGIPSGLSLPFSFGM
jgi:hypothetical protein